MRVLTIGPGRSYRPGKGQIALAHRLYLLLIHNEGAVRIGDAIARQWLERRRRRHVGTRRPCALPSLLFGLKVPADVKLRGIRMRRVFENRRRLRSDWQRIDLRYDRHNRLASPWFGNPHTHKQVESENFLKHAGTQA